MRIAHAFVICAAPLASCASPSQTAKNEWPPVTPTTLSAKQLAIVHSATRASLKDPESARFGKIVGGIAPDANRTVVVCGYVNAKNSYGGYTGMTPFAGAFYTPTEFTVKLMDVGVDHMCAKDGLPL